MINRHDNGVYAKVKKLQYNLRTRSTTVKSKEGRILNDNEETAKRWKEYIEELYEGEEVEKNMYIKKEEDVNTDTRGPCISKEECEQASRELSDKKATSIDKIPAEIMKNLDEDTKPPYSRFSMTLTNMV